MVLLLSVLFSGLDIRPASAWGIEGEWKVEEVSSDDRIQFRFKFTVKQKPTGHRISRIEVVWNGAWEKGKITMTFATDPGNTIQSNYLQYQKRGIYYDVIYFRAEVYAVFLDENEYDLMPGKESKPLFKVYFMATWNFRMSWEAFDQVRGLLGKLRQLSWAWE